MSCELHNGKQHEAKYKVGIVEVHNVTFSFEFFTEVEVNLLRSESVLQTAGLIGA